MATSKQIGERIRSARQAAGYSSPERFAVALGISASTLQRWETGKTNVTVDKLLDVVRLTGVPLAEFLKNGDTDGAPAERAA